MNFRRSGAIGLMLLGGVLLGAADQSGKLSMADAKKLKNPVAYTKKTITQGKNAFGQFGCVNCHGEDGKATVGAIADATDLTSPKLYKSGTSDGEIFRSIRDGAGEQMPPFKAELPSEEYMWYLVNYIHSLWPESMRPPLQDDK